MNNIKENDVVMLRSCGPPMTVMKIKDEIATCIWFTVVNKDSWQGTFVSQFPVGNLEILESANDEDATKFN